MLQKTNTLITTALPSSFLLVFIAEHDDMWYGIFFWSFWVSYVPSQPVAHPQSAGLWGYVWWDRFDAVQALPSNSQNTGELPTPFYPQIQSTALYVLLWRKSAPSQPDPIYLEMGDFLNLFHLLLLIFFSSFIKYYFLKLFNSLL